MAVDPRSEGYRRRLYRRYLWIALIPFTFFVILGGVSILLSQNIVIRELSSLKERNLRQVADNLELWFGEADSIALSLSTDPELSRGAEYLLKTGIPSHEDLKLSKSLQSLLASAVNSRLYLHSVTVATDNSLGLILTSTEGLIREDQYPDADWTKGVKAHAAEITPWTLVRSYHPLPNFPLSFPILSFYRNILGTGTLEKKGVLAVNVDIRKLDSLLEKEAESAGGTYILVDRTSGKPIAGAKLGDRADEVASYLLAGLADPPAVRKLKPLSLGKENYLVASLASERFPFAYFLLSPSEEFRRIPRRVTWIGGLLAALALAVGGALAVALARRNFRLLDGILDMVDAAGRGVALPAFHSSRNEAFDYVSLAVLKTFVEHDYYKIRLSERELRQRTLELTALQAQMNPHFLFNTMTTIAFKAMQLAGGRNDVSDMVKELSEMLAYGLADAKMPATLSGEFAQARRYIAIQRRRFGPSFRCVWKEDKALSGLPCIKLILQPLVENAFEHGFGGEKKGRIQASSRRDEKTGLVVLEVEDDGKGMSPERLAEVRKLLAEGAESAAHVGLVNTGRRLNLAYGEAASCEVESQTGEGTKITLRFPDKIPENLGAVSRDEGLG
ncbi:MAG: histidine kinase [Spirochaetes bacterium]|nr:histidine kinase [Spirochaetota bacterium]